MVRNYLDAHTITNFDVSIFGSQAQLMNDTNAFMAAYLTWLRGIWQSSPGVLHDTQIRVADSRMGSAESIESADSMSLTLFTHGNMMFVFYI